MLREYLYDKTFLSSLVSYPHKIQHVRLKVFNKKKQPTEYIEGLLTGGSITVDGAAAIRRTCSLSVAAPASHPITNEYWSLTHEFEVEIGLENQIDPKYDSIIWFPMGHFLITSFSKNQSTTSTTINISGQDLAAKLNGTQGGSFPHEINFGVIDIEQQDGSVIQEKVKIKTIIEQAVQEYGQEDLHNIIINDLPEHGLELLEYRGSEPMYLILEAPNNTNGNINNVNIINYTLEKNTVVYVKVGETGNWGAIPISNIPQYWSLNILDSTANKSATIVKMKNYDSTEYKVAKIEYGHTIGYRKTDLVYAGDLVLKAGDSVVSLLDKIKTMLGSFEYFYDTNGQFVLQKKKDYVQEIFSPTNGDIVEPLAIASPYAFEFQNDNLFISKSIQPSLDNLKNDFVIWGKKSSASGAQLDIHARYAIDKKPLKYTSPWERYQQLTNLTLMYSCQKRDNNIYIDNRDNRLCNTEGIDKVYVLAKDEITLYQIRYVECNEGTKFYMITNNQVSGTKGDNDPRVIYLTTDDQVVEEGKIQCEYVTQPDGTGNYIKLDAKKNNLYYYHTGIEEVSSGYKKIYVNTEITNYTNIYENLGGGITYISHDSSESEKKGSSIKCDWRELIYQMAYDYSTKNQETDFYLQIANKNPEYLDGKTGYEQYYSDMLGFWRLLYNPYDKVNCYTEDETSSFPEQRFWNKETYNNPTSIIFWFDFLDVGEAPLGRHSVKNIGMRQKVVNQSSQNTNIFLPTTPEIIFNSPIPDGAKQYIYMQVTKENENLFSISSYGLTLIENMNELLYNHAYFSESVTLNTIPMFWLQPNTRIYVEGIGDLIINKISFSLQHGGTMNLTCKKITNNPF